MYSSNDFFIVRRYGKSCARCLLRLQNEIGKLERQIEDIDSLFRNQPAGHGRNDSFDEDPYPKRVDMIKELEGLLQRYCEKPVANPPEKPCSSPEKKLSPVDKVLRSTS